MRGPWKCRSDRRAIQSGKPRVSLDCEPPPQRPRVPVAPSLAAARLPPDKARGEGGAGARGGQEAGLSVGRRRGGRCAGTCTRSERGASPALSRAFDGGAGGRCRWASQTASDGVVWPLRDTRSSLGYCSLGRMWKRVFCFTVRVKVDGLLSMVVQAVSLFPWTHVDKTHGSWMCTSTYVSSPQISFRKCCFC